MKNQTNDTKIKSYVKSAIDNINFNWTDVDPYITDITDDVCLTTTPFGAYTIKKFDYPSVCYKLYFNDYAINDYKDSKHTGWLSGTNMKGYLTDMVICQEYAKINHLYIHHKLREIYENLVGGNSYYYLSTMHNYIDFDCNIPVVRKGAVRTNSGEMFILPFNMRDGIAICTGKGNVDWNCTSPQGAGRKMSRNMAKNSLSVKKFQNQMKESGVYTTTGDKTTIDEAPDAYKDMNEIIKLISPTCKIEYFMKPKINLKAAE